MKDHNEKTLRFKPAGDRALLIEGAEVISPHENLKMYRLMLAIEREVEGVEEVVPGYRSLLVYYDPFAVSFDELTRAIRQMERRPGSIDLPSPRLVYLPVLYGGDAGPDIRDVAVHNALTMDEVIQIHTAATYRVYMIGFLPGFPYLGGLSPKLFTPRLPSPRTRVPAGSVGIAGNQTGVYPMESPGGWRLIGRTPVELYMPQRNPPVLLLMGDFVKLFPVSPEEFHEIRAQVERGEYRVRIEEAARALWEQAGETGETASGRSREVAGSGR